MASVNYSYGTGRAGSAPAVTPGSRALELATDRPVWERQPTETEKSWKAFVEFRDSTDRKIGRDNNYFAAKWSWGYRALEYDRWLDRKDIQDAVRYRRQMNERQRKAATLAQQKVVQWLMNVDPSTFTPSEAARWLEVAVKIERLAGGGSTERIAVSSTESVSDLSAEEVSHALAGLQNEIQRVLKSGGSDQVIAGEVVVDDGVGSERPAEQGESSAGEAEGSGEPLGL